MVVSNNVLPYKYHKRMTISQLEYVVFVLVEKYREQNPSDLLPAWWPQSVTFCHPMVRDREEINITDWKIILWEVIESYKLNGDTPWLRELLHTTLHDNENKYIHLIRDNTIENKSSKLINVVENKTKNDKKNSKKSESKIRIKESALIKLLPQPVVLLCDVVRYGFGYNKEDFLLKLNLMKTDKQLVHTERYKFRRLYSPTKQLLSTPQPKSKNTNKNLLKNSSITKPEIVKKRCVVSPCYVKLNTIEAEAKKNATDRKESTAEKKTNSPPHTSLEINDCLSKNEKLLKTLGQTEKEIKINKKSSKLSLPNLKTDVTNLGSPFVMLTPISSNKTQMIKSDCKTNSEKLNSELMEFKTKNPYTQTTIFDFQSTEHFSPTNNKKNNFNKISFKKSKTKKNIIKVKWLKPKLKMRISI